MEAHTDKRRRLRAVGTLVAVAGAVAFSLVVPMTTSQAITTGQVTDFQVVPGTPAQLDGPGSVTVSATCPSGQTAVSAGVDDHSPLAYLSSLEPTSAQTWTAVVGQTQTLGFTQSVTPYVVCVDTASIPGFYISSNPTTVGPGQSGITDAFCNNAPGDVALGGGFANSLTDARTNISIWLTGDARFWQVGVFNSSGTTTDTLTVYVSCLPGAELNDYVQQKNTFPTSFGTTLDQPTFDGATTNTSGAPYCPQGDVAIGGGAFNHDQTNAFISSLIPAPQGDPHYWNETSTELSPPVGFDQWAEAYDVCVSGTVNPCPMNTTTTITGTHSGFTATSGVVCVNNAHITGGITVTNGAQLIIVNSVVSGSITSYQSGGLTICGSTFSSATVTKSTGFVRIGDPANGCAPNHILGSLTVTNNTGGGAVIDNTIAGSWGITNNNPPFTVSGNHH